MDRSSGLIGGGITPFSKEPYVTLSRHTAPSRNLDLPFPLTNGSSNQPVPPFLFLVELIAVKVGIPYLALVDIIHYISRPLFYGIFRGVSGYFRQKLHEAGLTFIIGARYKFENAAIFVIRWGPVE